MTNIIDDGGAAFPGLCKFLKRKPTREEWSRVVKDSPFLKGETKND